MSKTLLNYAFFPSPSPLQAGSTATLELVISNGSKSLVKVGSIIVTLPVGTNAADLVADPAGITVTRPKEWSSAQNGGEFRLTPNTPEAGTIRGQDLRFSFARVRVNERVGPTHVDIAETAANPGQEPRERLDEKPLDKFPAQFRVSDLTADRLAVDAGGTVTLQWAGSLAPPQATYRLQYNPGSGMVDASVGNNGPYTSQPLHRTQFVFFTLIVSAAVPGQDQPLVVQRQVVVEVQGVTIDRFDAMPPVVPVNGIALLAWNTTMADSVTLQPGNRTVEPNGRLYVHIPQTESFGLIAADASGNTLTQQRTVRVDPTIKLPANALRSNGQPGEAGPAGDDGPSPTNGRPGEMGEGGADDVVGIFALDLKGTSDSVGNTTALGGNGGRGGDGGNSTANRPGGNGGRGGDGGPGGKITLATARGLLPSQQSADVSGGAPGCGGDGGRGSPKGRTGDRGDPGAPGTLRLIETDPPPAAAARRVAPARSDTLLGYALLEQPENDGTITMTLSVSGAAPEVEAIAVPLPLLAKPHDWAAADDGRMITLTPLAGLPSGGATFTFDPVDTRPPVLVVEEMAGGRTRTATFEAGAAR